jgi:hypothetical protein
MLNPDSIDWSQVTLDDIGNFIVENNVTLDQLGEWM